MRPPPSGNRVQTMPQEFRPVTNKIHPDDMIVAVDNRDVQRGSAVGASKLPE